MELFSRTCKTGCKNGWTILIKMGHLETDRTGSCEAETVVILQLANS